MSQLSREAILTVLSGLTVLGCDKPAAVKAEPAASAQVAPSAAAPGDAAPAAAAASAPGVAGVNAKEVPSALGKADKAAEKEKTCSPGGCAPGQCGGKK